MAELHTTEARRLALDLLSGASTVFPEEWSSSLNDAFVLKAFNFAAHAYRVNELCSVKSLTGAASARFKYQTPHSVEDDYQKALNLVRHAQSLRLGWVIEDRTKIYLTSAKQVIPSYLLVVTDKGYTGQVSLFGIAFVFLTNVVQELKTRFPDLKF